MDHAPTLRRLYDELNSGDIEGFGALLAADFVDHEQTPGVTPTRDGTMEFFRMWIAAFPDIRMDVQDVVTDGDKAVARVRATGTHRGEFMGVPASGRSIDMQIIDIMRFDAEGLVSEHWGLADSLAMMQQIGALPEVPA